MPAAMTTKGVVADRHLERTKVESSLLPLSYAGTPGEAGSFSCLGSFLSSPGSFKMPSELKFLLAQKNSMQLSTSPIAGKILQCPARRLAVSRNSQGHSGTAPFRNQKAATRMRFGSLVAAMLTAKRGLNLADGFDPLGARLPFPKHYESLSAHAAVHFSVAIRTFAEHLHFSRLQPPDSRL
jgi:hypothetical protein